MSGAERVRGAPTTVDSVALAERICAIASDKLAIDVRLIDVRELVSYTDFLIVCSGNTERQNRAIKDAIYIELKDSDGLLPHRLQGETEAHWILLDYLDCVVHILTPETRAFYRLEHLWGEAPSRVVE